MLKNVKAPLKIKERILFYFLSGVACPNSSYSQKGRGLKNGISYEIIKLKYVLIDKLYYSFFIIEILIVKGKKVVISSIYRPNSKYSNLTSSRSKIYLAKIYLPTLSTCQPSCENIRDSSTKASTYINAIFASGFLQITTKPTRCPEHSAMLFDHALMNRVRRSYSVRSEYKRI
jgi:hypothetical protein